MLIIRDNVCTRFTKIDKQVWELPKEVLSDGAKVLYVHLLGLQSNRQFTDKYISKRYGISLRSLAKKKKELKDLNLILIKQTSPRFYVCFVGYLNHPASKVKEIWESGNKAKSIEELI
jgi:hypothetical protein